ncbi:MAG: hypothetical protein ACFE9L_00775 [Candidatus Hodarchaeota archaeon]
MKIVDTTKLKFFKKIMSAVVALLEDLAGNFVITPSEGVRLRNMDKSRFALIDLTIKPVFFEGTLQCDKEYGIAVNVKDFQKVLERVTGDGSLEITLDHANDALKFQSNGFLKKNFALPLTTSNEDQSFLESDSYEPTVNAKLRGAVLAELIKDVAIVGENVQIGADSEKLVFTCLHDRKEVTIDLVPNLAESDGDSPVLELHADGYAESLYSISMLKDILKLDSEFAEVQFSFSSYQPLKLVYSTDEVTLSYLLAPVQPDTVSDEDDTEEEEEELEA